MGKRGCLLHTADAANHEIVPAWPKHAGEARVDDVRRKSAQDEKG